MGDNSKCQKMQCFTSCIYFPLMSEEISYNTDENGVKHLSPDIKFYCGYDNHQIINWYDECPREKEKIRNKEV